MGTHDYPLLPITASTIVLSKTPSFLAHTVNYINMITLIDILIQSTIRGKEKEASLEIHCLVTETHGFNNVISDQLHLTNHFEHCYCVEV